MDKRPVIFLDRDGVICVERGYVTSLSKLRLFPYARESVTRMHALGYAVIVITNQSAIARGLVDEAVVADIHYYIIQETGVDRVYCCPHLPPEPGEPQIPPYRIFCNCRKPHTGLINQAVRDHEFDLNRAYFVGDRASDIETGQVAGIRTVLLQSGYGLARLERPVKPDLVFDTLLDFVMYLEGEDHSAVSAV